MADGNFMVKNSYFKLSGKVSERMSVQSFQQRNNSTGDLWIDNGTNVSAMGRNFKMIEDTGRKAT